MKLRYIPNGLETTINFINPTRVWAEPHCLYQGRFSLFFHVNETVIKNIVVTKLLIISFGTPTLALFLDRKLNGNLSVAA